ncbi:hypothetical protein Q7C36_002912 [Tachysurus vachellii]|uniref:HAT C-terminal dimerisation domain-containing protein n=1 Tax=Tachysurus vachellii TaxID=175792 RepID=A0AA88T5G7_TACVA|nr:hypothetical protein Q7C36_002912 [Tachysurus vachellii]
MQCLTIFPTKHIIIWLTTFHNVLEHTISCYAPNTAFHQIQEWDSLLTEVSLVAEAMEISAQFQKENKQKRKRKCMPDEDRAENTFEESICETFAPILKLTDMSQDQMKITCRSLTTKYNKDLTAELENEMKTIYSATFSNSLPPLELLNAIYKMQLRSIFGEVCIALRIFCTLPVTVAGGERAFSKLKLVKNYLRSTMSQERLNSLALLSIESKLAKKMISSVISPTRRPTNGH